MYTLPSLGPARSSPTVLLKITKSDRPTTASRLSSKSLVSPETRDDPESPLRWTTKSTRNLADELTEQGHEISHNTVAKPIRATGYSLQATQKKLEGAQHPDRDAQFRHINALATRFLAAGDPVISVDTKKNEPAPRGAQSYSQFSWEEFGGKHSWV
jgi:Rhodopirellula transposase DDE domain